MDIIDKLKIVADEVKNDCVPWWKDISKTINEAILTIQELRDAKQEPNSKRD